MNGDQADRAMSAVCLLSENHYNESESEDGMNDSRWFIRYKHALRLAILALLIISLLGPWMFDLINVPAEYPCDEPFVRLEGDFCGYPLSGFFALYLLPILPFLTTVLLIWKKETPSLRTINLVAWIITLIPTVFIFLETQRSGQVLRLWGPLLYILVAVSAIIFEILLLQDEQNHG